MTKANTAVVDEDRGHELSEEDFQDFKGYAMRFASSFNVALGEDVVEYEVMGAIMRCLPTWRKESSFKTMLFRVARNGLINRLKKERHRHSIPLEEVTDNDLLHHYKASIEQPYQTSVEQAYDTQIVSELIHKAINALSKSHQTVIQLFYFEGKQCAEIAKTLGIPVGTVRSKKHYALEFLEAEMKDKLHARGFL